MKLLQLLEKSSPSNFILIQDDKEAKGGILLNEIIKQNTKPDNNVILWCFENNPIVIKDLPDSTNLKVYYHYDIKKWLDNCTQEHTEENLPRKFIQEVSKTIKAESKNIVVIDSLAHLVLNYSDSSYKIIHQLINLQRSPGSHQLQVVSLLHTDVIPGGKLSLLMFEQLATTNITVEKVNGVAQATTKHRKASGRVLYSTEQFYRNKNDVLITKDITASTENQTIKKESTDWTSNNITFKLELEDGEKQARSELILPYLKTAKSAGSSQIVYEPDALDDWDEEDPDDDLDI